MGIELAGMVEEVERERDIETKVIPRQEPHQNK